MSIKHARPFRILALPLVRIPHGPLRTARIAAPAAEQAAVDARHTDSASTSTSDSSSPGAAEPSSKETPLMLYHVQQPAPPAEDGPLPIYQRALDRAAGEWNKLGKKPPKSWMRWFHDKGEKLMDRIDYEEWALKNIHEGRGLKIADTKKGEVQERIEIPLLRPTLPQLGVPPLLPKLHRSLLHAIPYHRKSMYKFLFASPLTWPFAIIPIVPNFPLFYVLWRAWSHYKAWRGATYLETLLQMGMIKETPSDKLNEIYADRSSAAPVGRENIAPDATRARLQSEEPVVSTGKPGPAETATAADAASLPAQAKGETAAAGDGTSTPADMVFKPSEAEKVAAHAQAETRRHSGEPNPTATYPGMMLMLGQVPALQRDFDLSDIECDDVSRAIEQADHRAREAQKVLGLKEEGKKEGMRKEE